MNTPIPRLAAALIVCAAPVWAAATDLPAYETYSAAADSGNFFDASYTQLLDVTSTAGGAAQISGDGYMASASTTLGSNHAYASASAMPSNVLSAGSFSGWYDQVTITGGSGTGTAYFTVQLNGTVDVGAFGGGVAYALGTSTVHPSQLVSNTLTFNTSPSYAWPMDAVNPVATYSLLASPYNDPSYLLGLSVEPSSDQILTPGTAQGIGTTLYGTLNFTYGESFYLIGGMLATLFDVSALQSFCSIETGVCTPPADGTGATTLDFSNSANLVSISLPTGATASFASGASYNVTTVPEPGEWAMLLAGLGIVGWRIRRKAT